LLRHTSKSAKGSHNEYALCDVYMHLPSRIRHTLELFFGKGVPKSFFADSAPNRCCGHINTTKRYRISRGIQWNQSRGLKPRFSGKKFKLFNWCPIFPRFAMLDASHSPLLGEYHLYKLEATSGVQNAHGKLIQVLSTRQIHSVLLVLVGMSQQAYFNGRDTFTYI